MSSQYVDERYYEATPPRSLGERVVIAARDRIYYHFISACQPDEAATILDVGVSDVINDAANVLERRYPHAERITALGLGDGHAFRAEFPKTRYCQILPNEPLPFADDSFDIATSNAVLEHVGGEQMQARFIAELTRVATLVHITVPHRYFPVEHHTALPFVHYLDSTFRLACRLTGKTSWTDPANLILMTRARLRNLLPEGVDARIGYTGLRLGPMSSNLELIIDRRKKDQ